MMFAPNKQRLMRQATYASLSVATVLLVVKFVAWRYTDSVALLSSVVDSLLDLLASIIILSSVHFALAPADKEHRFGHGKMEALASLAQAVVITGSAVYVGQQAINKLMAPQLIQHSEVGLAVMVFSIALTYALVRFQKSVVERSGSLAIAADSLHYKTDLLLNAGVIVALVLSTNFGIASADPVIGVGIAVIVLLSALRIGARAMNVLIDRELPDEDRGQIAEIVEGNNHVLGMHDLRTRSSGTQQFIQFHLELEPSISLEEAHQISDTVEKQVARAFPDAEVLIHADPFGLREDHRLLD